MRPVPRCAFPALVLRGPSWAVLGVVALVLLGGCGDTGTPGGGERSTVSAFRLASTPELVEHSIPLAYFRNGIGRPDPRDAIPAILEPLFAPVRNVRFLRDDARVLVVEIARDARAYPLAFLDRHELVNDIVGGTPVLVTWCPLCGSSMVYEREIDGEALTFGVSGYLYKSDVLMYDHQSESFWSQLHQGAVAGPRTGTPLTVLPSRVTSLEAFRRERPGGKVLRGGRGMRPPAAYAQSPYAGYADTPKVWFPVGEIRDDLPVKAEVIGLLVGEDALAVALTSLRQAPDGRIEVRVGEQPFVLTYDPVGDAVRAVDGAGAPVVATRLFWFAWQAFHPRTRVH